MIQGRAYFGKKKYPYTALGIFFAEFPVASPVFIIIMLVLIIDLFKQLTLISTLQNSLLISGISSVYLIVEIIRSNKVQKQRAMSFFLSKKLLVLIASKKDKFAIEPEKLAYEFYHVYKKNRLTGPALKIYLPGYTSDLTIQSFQRKNKMSWNIENLNSINHLEVNVLLKKKSFVKMLEILSLDKELAIGYATP